MPLAVWLGITLVGGWITADSAVGEVVRVLLQVVVALAMIVASLFAFIIVGNIIAAPFNSKLSEAVEEHVMGSSVSSGAGVVAEIGRSLMTAVGRLLIFVLIYPLIFAVQFIPVVGIILHPVLAVIYGAFVLSLDFSDPTFERHLHRFRDKVAYIRARKALYLGFGLTAVAMAIIPLINFLLLPVCVTSAALLYLDESKGGSAARP